jgi:hypothetical protein
MRPSSFQQLPINTWTYRKPELGNLSNYRQFPTFINAKEVAVPEFHIDADAYSALSTPLEAKQVMSYYFDQVFEYDGFEFRFQYTHGKTLTHKRGFSRHQAAQYRKVYQKDWDVVETGPDGDIYIFGQPKELLDITVSTDDYNKEIRIPNSGLTSYEIDNILFERPFLNWTAAVKKILPDMGGYISHI